MTKSERLEELLSNFLDAIPDLLATIVIDLDGFIFAKNSIKDFDNDLIGVITANLDQTLNRIKKYTDTKIGSGSFDTDEFRFFYIELGSTTDALLLLIGKPYSKLEDYIPFSHIIAQKVSMLLNNEETSIQVPLLHKTGELKLNQNSKTITFIGSEKVGKTSLIKKFERDLYEKKYIPTIGISIIEKEVHYPDGESVILNFFDLGGIKSFAKVRRHFYKYTDILIIVFDYSRIESFTEVEEWINESSMFLNSNEIPYILVGNKIDLLDNQNNIREEALRLSKDRDFLFFETSCITGDGIVKLFNFLTVNSTQKPDEKIKATPISEEELRKLSSEERLILISKISCDRIEDCDVPNVIEKNILFNIAKNKEISLSSLMLKMAPLEKALNRTIDKEFILKIVDRFVEDGQVEKLFLNVDAKNNSDSFSYKLTGVDR
jgi:small GTP-binding protein